MDSLFSLSHAQMFKGMRVVFLSFMFCVVLCCSALMCDDAVCAPDASLDDAHHSSS